MPLDLGGKSVFVTVSIGIASFPEDGAGIDVIMERADQAMYRAKNGGRNRVISYVHAPNSTEESSPSGAFAGG
jgi:diguanylate cyclase (GGDEF)-like protein